MIQPFRTQIGGLVERWNAIRFTFDGRALIGFKGDTLASALLANGIFLVGRSVKYHRPRGILAAGSEEPNALVRIVRGHGRDTPNLRATQIEIYEGLAAVSQNNFPSLAFDLGAIARLGEKFLLAGFYYKTFMPSLVAWKKLFEPAIRHAAGLGRAPIGEDPDQYANRYAHCDVLIIGAGPAGLAAARAAAATGVRVILCDEQAQMGGSLLADSDTDIEGRPARDWVASLLRDLYRHENIILLPRTTAFGYYADNFVALAERRTDHQSASSYPRERLWQVRAKEVVLATGAIERPLVFPNNDRPGIMLADAARVYLNRYAVRPGTTAIVLAAHDSGYRAALDLHAAGIPIALIADPRETTYNPWVQRAQKAGIRVAAGTEPVNTFGHLRVHTLQTRHGASGTIETHHADLILMAGGWTPTVHLFSQSRGRLRFDEQLGAHVPDISVQRERSAGACRGLFDLNATLEDGHRAGAEAATTSGAASWSHATIPTTIIPIMTGTAALPITGRHAFVDFQNDVTISDIQLALREGFRSVEHVKRYTATGMATDQGKLSNVNTLAVMAQATNRAVADLGLTSFRPPYTPVTFGTLAGLSRGALFDPIRTTPLHTQEAAEGAMFENIGAWKRARYFPKPGEDLHTAVIRECRTVRETVGLFDASTLGKIDVSGPDAALFLDRLYATPLRNLSPGKSRYSIMLTEAGFVMDDGIVARLSETNFHVTTTTGGAARVLAHMEDYLQTEWPWMQVWLTSITEQFAVIALQGPRARDVLQPFLNAIDLASLPHMGVRDFRLCGIPVRLFRVSFTGEIGFEINIPADDGPIVWAQLREAVAGQGGCAYGMETMHVLRAEKGFFIVGQETDGTVIPDDLGFGALGHAKLDFVGKRSLALPHMRAPGRLRLVGLLTEDGTTKLEEGAQITAEARPPPGTKSLGHVTSSYTSAALGRPIALALLANGRTRIGETLNIPMPTGSVVVHVVSPVFIDPEGTRAYG
ncbi:MAG: sarcosine oxidase subunit alpha family protein [Acetobacteraceae bacterium]|nr:sarcosine oxidase subunit alpha family protein [Acetobacteraceae bacterium]MSP29673.1 sarcosine oxidase subunit alpha family protein [Acetobacteraceae bacterium]